MFLFEHDLRANAFRVCREGKPVPTFPDHALIVPIKPPAPLPLKCDTWIDVAINPSSGGGRHAFRIGPVGAIARNAPTPTLDAPGIVDRDRRRGAGQSGSAGRQQGQYRQHRIAHDLVSSARTCLASRSKRCRLKKVPNAGYSTCAPADLTTFSHFSVSAAIILPKASGVEISGSPPRSIRRALMVGSASTALISAFSFPMISGGVFFGAPTPNSALAS